MGQVGHADSKMTLDVYAQRTACRAPDAETGTCRHFVDGEAQNRTGDTAISGDPEDEDDWRDLQGLA